MNADMYRLLTMPPTGHIVGVEVHACRFGDTQRPVCQDCSYVGPFVTPGRAQAIAREHTAKSVGTWRPAC